MLAPTWYPIDSNLACSSRSTSSSDGAAPTDSVLNRLDTSAPAPAVLAAELTGTACDTDRWYLLCCCEAGLPSPRSSAPEAPSAPPPAALTNDAGMVNPASRSSSLCRRIFLAATSALSCSVCVISIVKYSNTAASTCREGGREVSRACCVTSVLVEAEEEGSCCCCCGKEELPFGGKA